ncbi:hypothetical protein [Salinilacihabitans rarus]|uniref:hypothetical protein n=1 Tax=Salinilacihabitans rarus TaxID=2961596 RepID=UPI0020C9353D|nr:hypothetical protein [Salinilacihabitans rarus]
MTSRDIAGFSDRVRRLLHAAGRYDLLLATIPLAFAGAALVGELFDVPFEVALLAGAAVAFFAVLDGLFLRPPTGLQRT